MAGPTTQQVMGGLGPATLAVYQQMLWDQAAGKLAQAAVTAYQQVRIAGFSLKAARDLSPDEALELLLLLHATGELELVKPIRWDPKRPGQLVSPLAGDQPEIGRVIGGVTFAHADDKTRPKGGAEGGDATATLKPTPAFAVVLYRLAKLLAAKWQVTEIVWGGIGGGRATTDCHSNGRCVDFYGVVRAGGQAIDVQRDWYHRPVYLPQTSEDGTHSPLYDGKGKVGTDEWGGDTDTYYRFSVPHDPQDVTPGRFFSDVYQFATEQCTVGVNDLSAEFFRRGLPLKQGFIFHPDYPRAGRWGSKATDTAPAVSTVTGRRTHHDHLHFQLGAT